MWRSLWGHFRLRLSPQSSSDGYIYLETSIWKDTCRKSVTLFRTEVFAPMNQIKRRKTGRKAWILPLLPLLPLLLPGLIKKKPPLLLLLIALQASWLWSVYFWLGMFNGLYTFNYQQRALPVDTHPLINGPELITKDREKRLRCCSFKVLIKSS